MGSSMISKAGSQRSAAQKSLQSSHMVLLVFWQEYAIPVAAISLIASSSLPIASLVSVGQVSRRAVPGNGGSYAVERNCPINERNESNNQELGLLFRG